MMQASQRRAVFLSGAMVFILLGCSGLEYSEKKRIKQANLKSERVFRKSDEKFFSIEKPKLKTKGLYPWEKTLSGNHPIITKEYFRCRGKADNFPVTIQDRKNEKTTVYDCRGIDSHSLPLLDEKEYIYPLLIDLLNYVQEATLKKVVITSGHRCPTHQKYIEKGSHDNKSRHLIGAAVDFYVEQLEQSPLEVVEIMQGYFEKNLPCSGFTCKASNYTRESTWENKFVKITLFASDEGRNGDNEHGYAYLCLEVKYEPSLEKSVNYNWNRAYQEYMRW